MSNPAVRILGTVKSVHGVTHTIGVDYDAVTIDGWQLGPEVRDDFARLYSAADEEAKAWAEAERRAEACELLDRAAMPGVSG